MPCKLISLALAGLITATVFGGEFEQLAQKAHDYRGVQPVKAEPNGQLVAEAEEFQPLPATDANTPAWKAGNWGENYYAATFANTFLSRKAFLSAPAHLNSPVSASINVEIPKAGRYLVLVRYEAAYRFETQFKVKVEQHGSVKLDRLYGARDNTKIWAFRGGGIGAVPNQGNLQKEIAWGWGAVENMVWEGHNAGVDLAPGPATITLIADKQPDPAAKRNVDLVLLTTDEADVKERIAKENYLPLDGLLTQAGDVFMRVTNKGTEAITISAANGTEHSPYWVHKRNWKPISANVAPAATTDWMDVGGLLDSLNDGDWVVKSNAKNQPWTAEFAVKNAAGNLHTIASFEVTGDKLHLAYDANTRYSQRIRDFDSVLYDLLHYLKTQLNPGPPLQRTLLYGYTFSPQADNPKYNAALDEFIKMYSLQVRLDGGKKWNNLPAGYIDVRSLDDAKLEEALKKIVAEGNADNYRVVSFGDEIGLASPKEGADDLFRAWAKSKKLQPADINPTAGTDWANVKYDPAKTSAQKNPHTYYYSRLFLHQYGIDQLKRHTELVQRYLPFAQPGANFTPHAGAPYLGETYQWITLFRQGGMVLPWSEDYTWQVPIGSPQVTMNLLDLARAGNRYHPEREILFYVMPHWPGNTPNSWRRNFYGAVGHGATILNLFEFRPVQAAYTENHTSLPEMYQEVRKSLAELARFEDIVQDGHVVTGPGEAALWYSEAGDAWDNHRSPFGAEKRSLYLAIRHQQVGLDIVDEDDALRGTLKNYKALYITDQNVSRTATNAIVDWVKDGGHLFVTAGGAMLDEFNEPNSAMQQLLGIKQQDLKLAPEPVIRLEKQDLPFAVPMDSVKLGSTDQSAVIPAFGAVSRISPIRGDVAIIAVFPDGTPALTRVSVGKGEANYCAFLPGLSYLKPGIPKRPVDRGATDEAMAHLLPTQFDAGANAVIHTAVAKIAPVVKTSSPTAEAIMIESPEGTAIVIVNWSNMPVNGLRVFLTKNVTGTHATLASGRKVESSVIADERSGASTRVFTLDVDQADAIILRK
ncbi:MAG: hypothetical protein IT444_03810 [Phycisphaeraceae bacterium]|nr:hypothetical protein [Phycisphaeraceae bacterium]